MADALPSTLSSSAKPRDGRLDVLRGLCLINMILVHLYEQGLGGPAWLHDLVVHWFRFAAGGFIVTSGMCIGAIHYQRALNPDKRRGTYAALWQRAGLVLLVHYFSVFLSLLVIPLRGQPVHEVGRMIGDVLRLYSGYELLLFYVVMLLAAPVMIEIARRFGAVAVLAISAALFCVGYSHPHLLLYPLENHFPLLRWQLVFVAGVVGGSFLPRFDALATATKYRILTGSAMATLCVAAYAVVLRAGGYTAPALLDVTKFPLSPLEIVRYVALTVTVGLIVDRLYPRLAGRPAERFFRAVGTQSLLLWVVHIYITSHVVQFQWVLAVTAALAGTYAMARLGAGAARWWQRNVPHLPRIGYMSPVAGSLLVIAVLRGIETPADFAGAVARPAGEAGQGDVALGEGTDDTPSDEPAPLDDDPLEHVA